MKVEILKEGVVACRPGQLYGWPGITKTSDGSILVSASERKYHIGPYGREVIVRSDDDGDSWSLPEEIYNSELDDRDANLVTLKNGDIVLSWFTSNAFEKEWPERAARVTDQMRSELLGTWTLRSTDNGRTWDKKREAMPVGMHVSPVELSDGSLITIGIEDRFHESNRAFLKVYKADKYGDGWEKVSEIPSLLKDQSGKVIASLNENHVLETTPGNLMALFRSVAAPLGDGYLYQSFSADFGCTWSEPKRTEIWGYPPHLLKLSDNSILCMYGHRKTPFSIRGVLSFDEGRTWDTDNLFTICEWEDETLLDIGYPVSVEVSPGEILTVFYSNRSDKINGEGHPSNDLNSINGLLSVRYKIS